MNRGASDAVSASPLRFGSVCSGIEAASVAWHPLGWQAAWFSEIEPFPCAVLAHHYPAVPNLGDMTTIQRRLLTGEVEAPDLLCGGTPCQAFSVAGKRESLADARGNLSLTFCEIANAIDDVRRADGREPCVVVWENVPGVLSTSDNAFGCFLGALAGTDCELQPAGKRWTDAGVVLGPRRAVAWRILDAQYFGLAQRRRRVFVVASARDGFDPAAVLFEFDGVRRDSAPRREARQTAPTIPARSTGGGGLGTDFDLDGGLIHAHEIARCVATREGSSQDYETTTMVAYAIQAGALRTNPSSGPDGVGVQADHAYTLEARAEVQAVCVTSDVAHTLRGEGFDASEDGTGRGTPLVAFMADDCKTGGFSEVDVAGPLTTTADRTRGAPIAFSSKDYGADAGEIAPTLRAMGHDGSHANGGGQVAVAVALRGREGGATAEVGDDCGHAFRASSGGGDKPHVLAPAIALQTDVTPKASIELAFTLKLPSASGGGQPAACMTPQMAVRRLTPRECERLQGFQWLCSPSLPGAWQDEAGRWWSPDYTAIPWRNKPASECPDGPRYKALGNSWAVPCVRWIGQRIAEALRP